LFLLKCRDVEWSTNGTLFPNLLVDDDMIFISYFFLPQMEFEMASVLCTAETGAKIRI
jgi:hypothetical protein